VSNQAKKILRLKDRCYTTLYSGGTGSDLRVPEVTPIDVSTSHMAMRGVVAHIFEVGGFTGGTGSDLRVPEVAPIDVSTSHMAM